MEQGPGGQDREQQPDRFDALGPEQRALDRRSNARGADRQARLDRDPRLPARLPRVAHDEAQDQSLGPACQVLRLRYAETVSESRRILKIERQARFEAARGVLLSKLEASQRDDGWFKQPGVLGCFHGRDAELRFPGGADCRTVRVAVRIRTGGRFSARPRSRFLRWLGRRYLLVRGAAPPDFKVVRPQREPLSHLVRKSLRLQDLGRPGIGHLEQQPSIDPPRLSP